MAEGRKVKENLPFTTQAVQFLLPLRCLVVTQRGECGSSSSTTAFFPPISTSDFPLFTFCYSLLISFSLWISSTSSRRPAHCPSHFTLAVSLPLFHAMTLHLPHSSALCDSLLPHDVPPALLSNLPLAATPPAPLPLAALAVAGACSGVCVCV